MHLSIPINFPSKIYISNDLLSLSFYEYTSNMLLRSINIKPSPRLFASIAPNTQPVAANTSNQSSTSTSTKKGSRLRKPALSLDQFIQRQRVLSFWREIMRAVYSTSLPKLSSLDEVRWAVKIPPSATRTELRDYARNEFNRNRGVEDVVRISSLSLRGEDWGMAHIRYLLSAGKTEFDTMRRYIDELASLNR
ncbi:hypothetical protein DPV78_004300 [Talaromyces pinophilus]|nr:hypothetical protein DPV78_004300 [Talaromyces pinophilus]